MTLSFSSLRDRLDGTNGFARLPKPAQTQKVAHGSATNPQAPSLPSLNTYTPTPPTETEIYLYL